MQDTPRSNRLHISVFGRRNAGKSSIVNALTNQSISLVSHIPGTTTDPVFKSMELLPLGPIVIIDTAGLDDEGFLGELRIKKTKEIMDRTDLALLVFSPENSDFSMELEWYKDLTSRNIPVVGVLNKSDISDNTTHELESLFKIPFIKTSAFLNHGILDLKNAIIENAPSDFESPTIVGDFMKPKSKVLLIAPQDIQAPKGRLILPQVQILRDVLDNDGLGLMVKDTEVEDLLQSLKEKPDLVITDSQIFEKVNNMIDETIPLTSFSILMARYKGNLKMFVDGAKKIDELKANDKVLIAEACTHHALKNDIGREKLPRWLEERAGGKLDITINAGVDFPEDLSEYKLIVHCGACMFTRKQLLSRMARAFEYQVPITNYGTAIAHIRGILDRVIDVFPEFERNLQE